jgi:hypothetical protein
MGNDLVTPRDVNDANSGLKALGHDPRLHIIRPAPVPTWPLHHLEPPAKAFNTI